MLEVRERREKERTAEGETARQGAAHAACRRDSLAAEEAMTRKGEGKALCGRERKQKRLVQARRL